MEGFDVRFRRFLRGSRKGTPVIIYVCYSCSSCCPSGFWTIWRISFCLDCNNSMFVTAVQAAARVNSGRFGGFPAVWTPVIVFCYSCSSCCRSGFWTIWRSSCCLDSSNSIMLQLFKLLPEWILDDLADFLLFGLQ